MTDNLVQLLPDAIANQIAAGEVIQRPASVVKELMENAIDAGADAIQLILKDSGKTLIQVVDDGCGMSETDARMSLERHATSKLRLADDLNSLRTMGFRGEALASIAAVSQLEIRTRRRSDDLGTKIVVEGSEIKKQEADSTAPGTSMAVRNLFYNVPARRNFLKSDGVELRHIKDEFIRLALAHPDLRFQLFHNDNEDLHLPAGKLRQRIVSIFGNKYNKIVIPVEEETDVLRIHGFVGKPEAAKKSRNEQFFFVNNRFIKSGYLHHAVIAAYDELLPKEQVPFYIICLELDPSRIDVNVHPTKQEIKFVDERLIYNFLKATIRQGLGRASVMPTLDFEADNFFAPSRTNMRSSDQLDISQTLPSKMNASSSGGGASSGSKDDAGRHARNLRNWEKLYAGLGESGQDGEEPGEESTFTFAGSSMNQSAGSNDNEPEILTSRASAEDAATLLSSAANGEKSEERKKPFQLHSQYIVTHLKSGFLLIDQQSAHERILYEQYLRQLNDRQASSQRSLFPVTLELPPADAELLESIQEELTALGFQLESFGGNSVIIQGVPSDLAGKQSEQQLLEELLEQYKRNVDLQVNGREAIARALARSAAVKRGQSLDVSEMRSLIDQLFACNQALRAPNGRRCYLTFELDELDRRFLGQ
ncbi:DNA mismatch repair protein MutL [Lewinellaceae bacterium SD302]|nr:DNA mismatch repair protein MutL [Lewinellaceae bacterium SD302]